MRRRIPLLLFLSMAAPLHTRLGAQNWGQYGVTIIKAPGFYPGFLGVNRSGQMAGSDFSGIGSVFSPGAGISPVGTLGGSYSGAYGVSNSGNVTGYSGTAGNAQTHAFLSSVAPFRISAHSAARTATATA